MCCCISKLALWYRLMAVRCDLWYFMIQLCLVRFFQKLLGISALVNIFKKMNSCIWWNSLCHKFWIFACYWSWESAFLYIHLNTVRQLIPFNLKLMHLFFLIFCAPSYADSNQFWLGLCLDTIFGVLLFLWIYFSLWECFEWWKNRYG